MDILETIMKWISVVACGSVVIVVVLVLSKGLFGRKDNVIDKCIEYAGLLSTVAFALVVILVFITGGILIFK